MASAFPARAAVVSWTNAAGGSWGTVANWNNPVGPNATNRLQITSGSYTVTLDDVTADNDPVGESVTRMRAHNNTAGALIMGAGGVAPTLLIDYTNAAKVLLLTAATGDILRMLGGSLLLISNGTVEAYGTTGMSAIGNAAGASPTLALYGPGAVFRSTNSIQLGAVAGATGTLDVAAGQLISDSVTVGGGALATGGGVGAWYARGTSSNVVGIVTVAPSTGNVGRLYVQDSAVAQFRTLNIGSDNALAKGGSTGLVYVTGGSLVTTGNQNNILAPKSISYGLLSVSNGVASFSDAILAAASSGSTGSLVEIQVGQGGRLTTEGSLSLGGAAPGSTGLATVVGSGILELMGSLVLGGAGGVGIVSNSGGATLRFTGLNTPTVTVNTGSSFSTADATIEFNKAAAFTTNVFSKVTFQGSNTLSLVDATNTRIRAYTVGSGQNFAALKVDSSSLWQSTNLTVAAGGTLSGPGNIGSVNVTNAGVISPGNSPGTLTFASNLTFMAGSVLNIELGGTNAADYDRLVALGGLALGGTLNVTLVNGYTPTSGDTVDILDWGALLGGTFATVNLPSAEWTAASLYTDGTLLYAVIPEPGTLALLSLAGLGWALFRRRAP